jgi:hypothetical protein
MMGKRVISTLLILWRLSFLLFLQSVINFNYHDNAK